MSKLLRLAHRGSAFVLAVLVRAPAVVLAVWGAAYVVACTQVLTAPGVPIEYRYESETGTMLVTAEAYQFDLERMEGIAQRIRITAPDGREVAAADTVDFLLDGDVFVFRLNDPVVRAKRLKDGSLDVLKMLPIRDEEEVTGGAFRLVAQRAKIEYSDETVDEPPIVASITGLGCDGANGTYMFRSDVEVAGAALTGGGSYDDAGRLIADVRMEKSDVTRLLAYARPFLDPDALGEWARPTMRKLEVEGNATVWSNPEGPLEVRGSATITAHAVRTEDTLRGATLHANVTGTPMGFNVEGEMAQQGLTANFNGNVNIASAFRMTGALQASAKSRSDLPPLLSDLFDPGVTFQNAAYNGHMDTDGERFLFVGETTASEVSFAGETGTAIKADVQLNEKAVAARIREATWAGVGLAGAVTVDFQTGALGGGLESQRGRLEPLAEHFGTDRLKGVFSASAVLGGTTEAPLIEVFARGSGGVKVAEGPLASLGVFEVRGSIDGDGIVLDRLTSNGENGALTAQGSLRWDGGITLKVNGGGLDVSSLSDNFKGLGFLQADVTGTREAPVAKGRLEVYGFEALDRKLPQIIADWRADKDALNLDRFAARAGTGQIDGSGALLWSDRSLNGSFKGTGVRLEEWLTDQTVGSVDVSEGTVAGTLDEPKVAARLTTGPVYAAGFEFDSAEMLVTGDKDKIESTSFSAMVGGGQVTGRGLFELSTKSGSLAVQLAGIPLEHIPVADYSLSLQGLASGWADVGFDATGLTEGGVSIDVEGLTVNGTRVGQGGLQASLHDRKVLADASIGSLERFLELTGASYDLDTNQVSGQLTAYNLLFSDITDSVGKAIKDWPAEIKDILANTTGLANAAVTASGTTEDVQIDVETFTLTDLKLRGRDGGTVRASGKRRAGLWTIEGFEWQNGDPNFVMTGQVSEEGRYDVKGDLKNFQASWLSTLFPAVPLLAGTVHAGFRAEGTFDDPTGVATLDAEGLGYYDGERAVNLPLFINLSSIEVSKRSIELFGSVNYQGLSGGVTGVLPFSSLYDDPNGRTPMDLKVEMPGTSFETLAGHLGMIDGTQSVGNVSGGATVKGLWGALEIKADIAAKGESLVFKQGGMALRNIDAKAKWDNGSASVTASFQGEHRGSGTLDLRAQFPDLFAEGIGLEQIKQQTTLNGNVLLDDYRVVMTLPNATGPTGATVKTRDLRVDGTIAAPRVTGNVALSEVYVRLPDEFATGGKPIVYPIDPRFDAMTINVAPGSRLVTGNSRIDFFGSGRVNGSLQNPDLSLPLTVTGGRFDMPTARIALEEGGTINVGYRSALGSAPAARVDLNLEGRTVLSARRTDNEYEAYQIQLFIRGNLLDEEGLRITATSDPPDLSNEQIMALLGRKELIENLARGGSDTDLRSTLYTVGLPTAGNLFTSGIARDLGLDYISIDYNPFDQTTIGVGKVVARGLMLHGNRQLEPNPGERLKYEVQLTYRLPMRDAFFSRVRLSFGFDELVPWQVKLNWAKRF